MSVGERAREAAYFAGMFLLLPLLLLVMLAGAARGQKLGKGAALCVLAPLWGLGAMLVWMAATEPAIRLPLLAWAAWSALVIGVLGYLVPWLGGAIARSRG